MQNKIINFTATAADWDTITDIPHETASISLQARTSAAVLYRWARDADGTYWTVKADTVRTIECSRLNVGDLEIQATNGVVVEIECSTRGTTFSS